MRTDVLRARLVRRARALGADVMSAEDLAQEALAEGWRLRDRLTDPSGIERWHYAILRNLYLRWASSHREVARLEDRADAFDVEVELERRELVELLDRALAGLPVQTREVLVRRFVEESPIREVAERLGMSEGAVQMRLARGKLALRQALSQEDAAAYGFADPDEIGWQQTRIWCPNCGERRWRGRTWGPRRSMRLDCPCTDGNNVLLTSTVHLGVKGFGATLRKVNAATFNFWRDDVQGLRRHGHRTYLARSVLPSGGHYAVATCADCELECSATLDYVALCTPAGQAFWREHPRIRQTSCRELESGGVPAVLTTYESVNTAARIDIVLGRESFQLIQVGRS